MMRDDSSRTRASEQRNLIGQMGLIEIAELCRHSCGAVRRRSFHVLQQRLEPHNPPQALWRKPYPIAEKAIQMAKTNLTIAGELPYSYLPAAFFNSFECHLNARVNLGVGQSLNQESSRTSIPSSTVRVPAMRFSKREPTSGSSAVSRIRRSTSV